MLVLSVFPDIVSGVDSLGPYLTAEQQLQAKPLLSFLTVLPDDPEASNSVLETMSLEVFRSSVHFVYGYSSLYVCQFQEKIDASCGLLRAIIQAYPRITKNLVFLIV